MRDALPPSPDGHARHGFTCQACGQLIVTDIEGLFTNPAVAAHDVSAHPAADKPPTGAASPPPPRTHPANTTPAAPDD